MPSKTREFRKESKKMSLVILPRLHNCLLSFFHSLFSFSHAPLFSFFSGSLFPSSLLDVSSGIH